MNEVKVEFSCGELSLEGILALPQGAGCFPAVIVCHPHPLYGGSMDNNVVNSVCGTLTEALIVSFKFNFRGVGGSEGKFGQGVDEQEDADAAISFITTVKEVDPTRIGLIGYSAGAAFALPVCVNNDKIKALAAISPPLSIFDFEFLKGCAKPKLLISGSKDDFTPVDQFLELCQGLVNPKEYDIIGGADHFWWGYESALAARVTAFFTQVL